MVALIICSTNLNAQRAEVGLRFMPTVSDFDIKSSTGGTINGEVTLGYGYGAFLGYTFGDHVGIQGEVIYTTSSQKYKEQDIERSIKLRYLNIPLLLSLNTGKTNMVNLNLVLGPQVGISVGSELISTGTTASDDAVLSVKKGDLGFAYGAGVDFGVNPGKTFRVGVGFRGVYGLIDISDDSQTIATNSYYILDRTHTKTYSGYLGLSYLF